MLRGVVFVILKGRVAIRSVGMVSQGKSTPSNSYGVYSFNYITDAYRGNKDRERYRQLPSLGSPVYSLICQRVPKMICKIKLHPGLAPPEN